ncbi:unnamed protein product [Acanthosepion pharaonis]|uniref:Uncharacterized protein n=1 Tax=Acanthosepion pharaonis TaxID=158019 RepID=A0A812B182_ACAPH|nr:unnamed protein product [Sepia pharaonis]
MFPLIQSKCYILSPFLSLYPFFLLFLLFISPFVSSLPPFFSITACFSLSNQKTVYPLLSLSPLFTPTFLSLFQSNMFLFIQSKVYIFSSFYSSFLSSFLFFLFSFTFLLYFDHCMFFFLPSKGSIFLFVFSSFFYPPFCFLLSFYPIFLHCIFLLIQLKSYIFSPFFVPFLVFSLTLFLFNACFSLSNQKVIYSDTSSFLFLSHTFVQCFLLILLKDYIFTFLFSPFLFCIFVHCFSSNQNTVYSHN